MNLIESTLRVRIEASSTTNASAKATSSTTDDTCDNDGAKAQVTASKSSKCNYSVSSVDLELRKVSSYRNLSNQLKHR